MQKVTDKPTFHKEFRKHAELGLTLIEMLIAAVLMALVAYLSSTLFMNFNDANRSANAKSTAHESFRILNMRFDNQIQNRIPFELAKEEFSSITTKSEYEKRVFYHALTRLKTHSLVVRNTPPYTRSYDRFVMSVECAPFNDWKNEYNTFIRNNTACGASVPICGSNSRPVIRYSQRLGLNKSQVTGSPLMNHSNNFREFPTRTMPLYQTAAAATFCIIPKGPNIDDDLSIKYYFFYFRAGKVLSWLETASHLGKEVNHSAGAFPKADR